MIRMESRIGSSQREWVIVISFHWIAHLLNSNSFNFLKSFIVLALLIDCFFGLDIADILTCVNTLIHLILLHFCIWKLAPNLALALESKQELVRGWRNYSICGRKGRLRPNIADFWSKVLLFNVLQDRIKKRSVPFLPNSNGNGFFSRLSLLGASIDILFNAFQRKR